MLFCKRTIYVLYIYITNTVIIGMILLIYYQLSSQAVVYREARRTCSRRRVNSLFHDTSTRTIYIFIYMLFCKRTIYVLYIYITNTVIIGMILLIYYQLSSQAVVYREARRTCSRRRVNSLFHDALPLSYRKKICQAHAERSPPGKNTNKIHSYQLYPISFISSIK